MKATILMIHAALATGLVIHPLGSEASPDIPILSSASSTEGGPHIAPDPSPLEAQDGSIFHRQVQTWPPKGEEGYQLVDGDASKFTCAPVEYFEPDAEIRCDIFKVATKTGRQRIDFQFVLYPIGVAYSQYGRDNWLAFVKKKLLENAQTLGILADYTGFLGKMSSAENNWGTGVLFYAFGSDNDNKKHGSVDEIAQLLEESILPDVMCAEYARSINWIREGKCKISEMTEG